MIQEATLIEAILSIRSQIDFLWQFFVTAHIAIFALLFIYDEAVESLNVLARVFALGGIALFEWINGKALANTYMLLDATMDQYRALYGEASRFQPAFFQHFVGQSFTDRPAMVLVTHSMALRRDPAGAAVARVHPDAEEQAAGNSQLMRRSLGANTSEALQNSHSAPDPGDNPSGERHFFVMKIVENEAVTAELENVATETQQFGIPRLWAPSPFPEQSISA